MDKGKQPVFNERDYTPRGVGLAHRFERCVDDFMEQYANDFNQRDVEYMMFRVIAKRFDRYRLYEHRWDNFHEVPRDRRGY